jgi:hypothetical protein
MNKRTWGSILVTLFFACLGYSTHASSPKVHTVVLGAAKRVPYSKAGDPAGAAAGEDALKIRPLVVDGVVKDWTTGDTHDVTDRSFVVRRAIRLNDALPEDKAGRWVWQRGPWVLVDRAIGHVTALRLPNYDPGVSQVRWFRDYGAYCGVTASGKSLYAVIAQVSVRKPVLSKKISSFNAAQQAAPACEPPDWQREPLRITFHPSGREPIIYNFVPGSAMLVEDSGDDEGAPVTAAGESAQ